MDINQLLHDHQIALVGKARAATAASRAAFGEVVTALAGRIRRTRKAAGADVTAAQFVVGDPLPGDRHR